MNVIGNLFNNSATAYRDVFYLDAITCEPEGDGTCGINMGYKDPFPARAALDGLIEDAIAIQKDQSLSPCQSVCLGKCISANYMEYDQIKMQSFNSAVESGVGLCREFSQVGDYIIDSLGVSSREIGSTYDSHQILKVWIDGKWFAVEPMSSSCRFFNLD